MRMQRALKKLAVPVALTGAFFAGTVTGAYRAREPTRAESRIMAAPIEQGYGDVTLNRVLNERQHSETYLEQRIDATTIARIAVPENVMEILAENSGNGKYLTRPAGWAVGGARNIYHFFGGKPAGIEYLATQQEK